MVKLTDLEENFFGKILYFKKLVFYIEINFKKFKGLVLQGASDSKKIEFKSERPLHITMASLDTSIECNCFFKLFILFLVKLFNYFR